MNKAQILQIMRFGLIGVTSAIVHFNTVVMLVQEFHYAPLVANIGGFIISFQVSYWGHRNWTFSDTIMTHGDAYPRLALVQMTNFAINEYLYYIFLSLHLPYQLALIMVIAIMPIFTFVTSKWWVFQS